MELKYDTIDGWYIYNEDTGKCTYNPNGKIYNSGSEMYADYLKGFLLWGDF